MRKSLTNVRARVIYAAKVSLKEDATLTLFPLQIAAAFLSVGLGKLCNHPGRSNPEMLADSLDIALRHLRRGYLAAIRAGCAIDLILDFFPKPAENAVRIIPRLHVFAELLVFVAFFVAQHADLDEVRYH
jgi:hypothetical protein